AAERLPLPHTLPDPQAAALLHRGATARTEARRPLGRVSFEKLIRPHLLSPRPAKRGEGGETRTRRAGRGVSYNRCGPLPPSLRIARQPPGVLTQEREGRRPSLCTLSRKRERGKENQFTAVPPRFQPRPPSPKISKPVSVTATVSSSLMKPRVGCFSVV